MQTIAATARSPESARPDDQTSDGKVDAGAKEEGRWEKTRAATSNHSGPLIDRVHSHYDALWRPMSALLGILQPPVGDLETPDLAVKRLGVAAGYPDLVLEDIGGMLVTVFPDHAGLQLCPVRSVR